MVPRDRPTIVRLWRCRSVGQKPHFWSLHYLRSFPFSGCQKWCGSDHLYAVTGPGGGVWRSLARVFHCLPESGHGDNGVYNLKEQKAQNRFSQLSNLRNIFLIKKKIVIFWGEKMEDCASNQNSEKGPCEGGRRVGRQVWSRGRQARPLLYVVRDEASLSLRRVKRRL